MTKLCVIIVIPWASICGSGHMTRGHTGPCGHRDRAAYGLRMAPDSCIAHLRYYRQHLPPISPPRQSRTWSPDQTQTSERCVLFLVTASSVTPSSPWAGVKPGLSRVSAWHRSYERDQVLPGECPGQLPPLSALGASCYPALVNICVSWRELQQLSHTSTTPGLGTKQYFANN